MWPRIVSFPVILAGLAALCAPAAPCRAGVVNNGGFESDNFDSWSTLGNSSVVADMYGTNPAAGNRQALLSTVSALPTDRELEAFLGLSAGTLDSLAGNNVTVGSAIKQRISGTAGEVLSASWNYLTQEILFQPRLDDFAFWTLVDHDTGRLVAGQVIASVDTSSLRVSSRTGNRGETGYRTDLFTLPTSGTFTLGFGVADVTDMIGPSALLVDRVGLSPSGHNYAAVPEPTALVLLMLGATMLLLEGLRRQRQGARVGASS